jgi:hypothetical protein
VTSLADTGPGTLRDALASTPNFGTIDFQPGLTGTISLTSAGLLVTRNVTIQGPGAGVLTVSGSNLFTVFSIGVGLNVTMLDFTVANGSMVGAGGQPDQPGGQAFGAGITSFGNLSLYRMILANNHVTGGNGGNSNGVQGAAGGDAQGAALFTSGNLNVFNSVFTGNSALGGTGGPDFGTGTGGVGGQGLGGAVYNTGTAHFTNSLLTNNTATGGNGGSGPTAGVGGAGIGGAIDNIGGASLTLIYCTFDANVAAGGADSGSGSQGGTGGGLANLTNATAVLTDTLIAQNMAGFGPDVSGTIGSADHNLLGNGDGSFGVVNGDHGNIVGSTSNPVNPRLGLLQNNGGPTPSRALLAGSPAIDAGVNVVAVTIDQRGFNRNVNGANDIGAYEYQQPANHNVLTSSSNPSQPGQLVTFTATVTADAANSNPLLGSVTFFDGSNQLATLNLVNGVASFATSSLPAGQHIITAHYSGFSIGDYGFDPTVSNTITQVVGSAGSGGAPIFLIGGAPGLVQIRLVQGGTRIAEFAPYGPGYTGPISVAVGYIHGPGSPPDVITGALVGNPDVRVFDGRKIADGTFNPANPTASLIAEWFPYALQFNVGVNVAVGDVSGNGFADIVTGASVGNPDVRVYRGQDIANGATTPSLLAQWFAYGLQFNIGATVAVGKISNNTFADIVTGASAGNPHVKVYRGSDIANGTFDGHHPDNSLLAQFFPYALQFNVGVNVAVGDVDADGFADVITGSTIGNPDVHVYDGQAIAGGTVTQIAQFFAYDVNANIGVAVAAADFENNGHFDILTGSTRGTPSFRVVHGLSSGVKPPALFEGIATDLTGALSVGA